MDFKQLVCAIKEKYPIDILQVTEAPDIRDIALIDGTEQTYEDDILYFGLKEGKTVPLQRIITVSESNTSGCIADISSSFLFAAFNFVRTLLDEASGRKLFDELVKTADTKQSITAVLNVASLALHNPLVFCNTNFKIISCSTAIAVIDPLWTDNIRKGYCSYEFINAVQQLGPVKNAVDTCDAIEVTCKESPYAKLFSKVLMHGYQIGFVLLIASETAIQPTYAGMLKNVSKALSYTVGRYASYLSHFPDRMEHLLYELLVGAPANEVAYELHDLSLPQRMAALSIKSTVDQDSSELLEALRDQLPEVKMVCYENAIAALMPLEHDIALSAAQVAYLEETAKKYHADIGISYSFSRIEEFVDHYRQAVSALSFVTAHGTLSQRLMTYKDIMVYDLLSRLDKRDSVSLYVHPTLGVLSEHDRKHHTQLHKTLAVFAEEGGSLKHTAARLFLHRNSLMYRLDCIRKLTGLDIADPSILFMLRLSYCIETLATNKT
jgi:hypothetical protein